MTATGRVLGIDFGRKRIGLALSDPLRMVATPLETVDGESQKKATRRLREILEEHHIREVVVGLPLHMNGDVGELALAATAFGEKLGKQVPGLIVHMWDERMTSMEAERALQLGEAKAGRKKQMRDQLAAQLILQSWLDSPQHVVPDGNLLQDAERIPKSPRSPADPANGENSSETD